MRPIPSKNKEKNLPTPAPIKMSMPLITASKVKFIPQEALLLAAKVLDFTSDD
jgi:hypothetical protein